MAGYPHNAHNECLISWGDWAASRTLHEVDRLITRSNRDRVVIATTSVKTGFGLLMWDGTACGQSDPQGEDTRGLPLIPRFV